MKFRKFTFSILLMVALLLGACQTQLTSPSLDGSSWTLVELNGQSVLADVSVTLNFDGESITGNDGCNHFGGSFTTEGNSFSIGEDLMSTLMACEEPIMQQAGEVTLALRDAQSFQLENERLVLLDKDGNRLAIFEAVSQELAGSSWLATFVNTDMNEGVVSSSSIQAAQQTLTFEADGKLSGNAGCNNYFGNYEVDGNKLTISQIGSTKMFCGDGLMESETSFLVALEQSASYKINGNALQINNSEGNLLMSLTRQ